MTITFALIMAWFCWPGRPAGPKASGAARRERGFEKSGLFLDNVKLTFGRVLILVYIWDQWGGQGGFVAAWWAWRVKKENFGQFGAFLEGQGAF
jgi:hypothetical protein